MSPDALITLAVLAVMLACLLREVLQPDAIVFSALGALIVTGVLDPTEALSGFSNSGMLTVAVLFVVAHTAQSTGILDTLANTIMGRPDAEVGGPATMLVRLMAPVAALSAFLNNTPVVAMFLPAVRDWAKRRGVAPSKLLIPLSYASIFGGICTLIGTSTTLVVNGMMQERLGESIGMFEISWVGVPCAVAGIAFITLFHRLILPEREDPSDTAQKSERLYVYEMKVAEGAPLIDKTVEEAGLRNLESAFLARIIRGERMITPVSPSEVLQAGDRLVFTGHAETAKGLKDLKGLAPTHGGSFYKEQMKRGAGRIIEVVVSRSSPLIESTIKRSNFRGKYDAVILAVHRHGENIDSGLGRLVLKPGDTLLLLAGEDFVKRWNTSRDFYMISVVDALPKVDKRRAVIAVGAIAAMVTLAATGVLDMLTSAILAAMLLFATRTVNPIEARRALEINVLVTIASALGISVAIQKTGLAAAIAHPVVGLGHLLGPVGVLLAVYVITSLLTELITNNAAAALVFPIAMEAALAAGLDPRPFAITVAVAASASFSTPIGYQTNLMVYGPGGYRFGDFLRAGAVLNLLFMAVVALVVPMVWPLT